MSFNRVFEKNYSGIYRSGNQATAKDTVPATRPVAKDPFAEAGKIAAEVLATAITSPEGTRVRWNGAMCGVEGANCFVVRFPQACALA